jgi:LPXTG-motif cell wall-anchored protein
MSLRRTLGVFAAVMAALLVGALPAQAAPSYPPKPPSISINKTHVVVGGTAVVTATGCMPGTTATVEVTAPGSSTRSKSVKVNGAGNVVSTVTFTTAGTNTVWVICTDVNGRLLKQSVKVQVVPSAAIWADQTVVHAGDKVKVSASGYAHNSKVTITVLSSSGASVLTTTATTDASGVVTADLPFSTAGTYSVQVLGVTVAGAPLSQTITITVLGAVMPHTGADIVPFSLGGVGLLIAGVGLVLVTRRRRSHA